LLAGFETESGDATPFHGVNKWPSEYELPGFRQTMEEYYHGMSAVASR
jgi:isopenicillin N synthase-like dioxygenase